MGDTILNQSGVGTDTGGDLAGTEIVEIGDVLAENGPEVFFSDPLGDVMAGVDETYGRDVGCSEDGDADVNIVEYIVSELPHELIICDGVIGDLLESGGQLSKEDLSQYRGIDAID